MIIEKTEISTTAKYSKDKQLRYLLRKKWDKGKPKASIIMINPSTASINQLDQTTFYILNNLDKLGFGMVDILNIVSLRTPELTYKQIPSEMDKDNLAQILVSVENSDTVILAWGKIGDNNSKISTLVVSLLQSLLPFLKKLHTIGNGENTGFHPLAPQIRSQWYIEPLPKEKSSSNPQTLL